MGNSTRNPRKGMTMSERFTDAELAAEYWAYCWLWERAVSEDDGSEVGPAAREMQRRAEIMERFATHPHAHQENL